AIMIEPTESESIEELDLLVDAMKSIAREVEEDPEMVKSAPHTTRVKRREETAGAAKADFEVEADCKMNFTATGAKDAKEEDRLSKIILDAAFRVHTALDPGLLESAYEACLAYELRNEGLNVLCQVPLPLIYKRS